MVLLLATEGDAQSPVVTAGIAQAEKRCPGFVSRMAELRARILQTLGRPIRIGFLDFGEAFWIDLGLHTTLRGCLESLIADSRLGTATRAFFDIPESRDDRGNIMIGSQLPPGAHVRNSVIVNSTILDPGSILQDSVVVGARHNRLSMPSGGAALFTASRDLQFEGGQGIAFRSVGDALRIPQGGRHTTLFLEDGPVPLISNESIKAYDDSEYCAPILGNTLSFEKAGNLVGAQDPQEVETRWKSAWQNARL
jgi:hypothetical protein